jgi:hypothetical protein
MGPKKAEIDLKKQGVVSLMPQVYLQMSGP